MNYKEYEKWTQKASPNSKSIVDIPKAFVIGGLICVIGQMLMNIYMYLGAEKEIAGTLVSVSLIFLSALLTGLNLYHKIAKHGGAGTLVPITGFANAVAAPAIEFKTEGFIMGVGAKMFVIAGPVIVYGTLASAVYGIIYWILKMI